MNPRDVNRPGRPDLNSLLNPVRDVCQPWAAGIRAQKAEELAKDLRTVEKQAAALEQLGFDATAEVAELRAKLEEFKAYESRLEELPAEIDIAYDELLAARAEVAAAKQVVDKAADDGAADAEMRKLVTEHLVCVERRDAVARRIGALQAEAKAQPRYSGDPNGGFVELAALGSVVQRARGEASNVSALRLAKCMSGWGDNVRAACVHALKGVRRG